MALMAAVAMATASSCAVEPEAINARNVIVRPRVVVDGSVELSDRTQGRVLLDRITAHAEAARVVTETADGDLVVVDDHDPLFFSYAPSHPEAQAAAEREWSLPVDGGALRVSFAPATRSSVEHAPFEVDGLHGHTFVIEGSIAIDTGSGVSDDFGFDAFGHDDSVAAVDPDGTPADVDPDGTPAEGDDAEIDPDGSPADVDPDGSPADVDPDGSPARSGQVGSVDPDGTPAIDPDGSPAATVESSRAAAVLSAKKKRQTQMQGSMAGRAQLRVPFTLTVDGAFEHQAEIGADALADVGDGEALPIDLRFQAAAFFDAARVSVLEALAAEAVAHGDESANLQVSAASTASVVDVQAERTVRRVRASAPRPGADVHVTGSQPGR
jgi:hypothetical protein